MSLGSELKAQATLPAAYLLDYGPHPVGIGRDPSWAARSLELQAITRRTLEGWSLKGQMAKRRLVDQSLPSCLVGR